MDHENIDHSNTRHANFLESFLGLESPPKRRQKLVVPVEPDRLHRRLTIQQGGFLCPTDLLSSFEENLAATFEESPSNPLQTAEVTWSEFQKSHHDFGAVRIVLPRSIHKKALQDLNCMNISSATLFPGLDGFARSMRYHVRAMGK